MQEHNWQDSLDDDFINIFAPYRTFQIIFGSCRVRIRDRMVTAPTAYEKFYTIICIIAATVLGRSFMATYSAAYDSDPRMRFLFVIGLSSLHILFSLSIIHARFINEGNVQLYKMMQNIDRVMRLNWLDNSNLQFKHCQHNRVGVWSVMITFAVLLSISIYLTLGQFAVYQIIGFNWAIIAFVLEMGCCSSHIKFFTLRINFINSLIINHIKKETRNIIVQRHSIGVTFWQDYESSDTDVYLQEIFCTYTYFQDQYKFQVFMFCYFFISWTVVSFRYIILALQSSVPKNMLILDFVHLTTLAILSICMLLLLSIRSELFMREVKKTKKLSNSILSRCFDGPLRWKAMRMLKLIEHEPPRFSVYGMWDMDARLLLNIFSIITNACVIILQFSFL